MKLTVGRILHACFKVLSTLHMIQLGNDTNANMSEILHPATCMLLYDKATVDQIEKSHLCNSFYIKDHKS